MEKIAQDIRRHVKQQAAFRCIIQALSRMAPLEERLHGVLQGLSRILSFDAFELIHPLHDESPEWRSLTVRREDLAGEDGLTSTDVAPPHGGNSILSRSIEHASPIAIDRDATDQTLTLQDEYGSAVAIPLLRNGLILGAFAVYSLHQGFFGHEDVSLLQQVGGLISLTLEDRRVRDSLKSGDDLVRVIAAATGAVSPNSDPPQYMLRLSRILSDAPSLERVTCFRAATGDGVIHLFSATEEAGAVEPGVKTAPAIAALPLPRFDALAGGVVKVLPPGTWKDLLPEVPRRDSSSGALALIPVRVEGMIRWVMAISAESTALTGETPLHLLSLLRNVAEQALVGIALYQKLHNDLCRVTGLLGMAKVLAEMRPNGDVFQVVMDRIRDLIEYDGCVLYLLDGGDNGPIPVASSEPGRSGGENERLLLRRRDFLERVMKNGKAMMASLEDRDPNGSSKPGPLYIMASPLLEGQKPFGLFCAYRRRGAPFNREDLTLLSILSGFTADAMKRSIVLKETLALKRSYEIVERHVGEGILFLDDRGLVTRASQEALRILGCTAGKLMGNPLPPHLFRDHDEARSVASDLSRGIEIRNYRTYARTSSDSPVPVELVAVPTKINGNDSEEVVFFLRDISARLRIEGALGSAARIDPLTGLGIQLEARPELARALERATRDKRPLSVVILKLNGLDRFNRRNGLMEGDLILGRCGEIIRGRIRGGSDRAFRLGGAELLLLLPETAREAGMVVVNRILAVARADAPETISFVGSITINRMNDTPDTLLNRLYEQL